MAETVKTCPYEVLVRFTCEHGEIAGAVRGIHLVQRSYLIDDAGKIVGEVVRAAPDPAPFPQEQLEALIGAAMPATKAAHDAALADMTAQRDAALKKGAEDVAATRD